VDVPEGNLSATSEPVPARPASTIILLRGGSESLELLLVQRNPAQKFMGGFWVFPGGAVDASDGHPERDEAQRAAAVRELVEEAGVEGVDPAGLVRFSRWVTPKQVSMRFDTHFFLALMPDGAQVRIDLNECVDSTWLSPADGLAAFERGDLPLVFPTIKHLEQLSVFSSAIELIEATRGREVVPVEPRVHMEGEQVRVLLPGDPGY
jgi:8-oxo-dGTP pyrophosphatase MutT (NUDIX family)